MTRRAAIIGAGLGGLATAIRLQHAGWEVTVLEKNDRVGGRCNVLREHGFTFDTGPTLLLMRDVFEELFRSVGRRLEEYVTLVRVHPNYRVHFADGSSLELSGDLERVEEELERVEPGAAVAFRRYLADAGYKYRVARERFVERNFAHWFQFLTPVNLYYLLATHTLRALSRHAARYFRDPRLTAALTFQSMYLGLAPHHAPAVYALLPYTEIAEGIWFPVGGMYRLVEALERLARELGVRIVTGVEVTGLRAAGGRVRAIETATRGDVAADVVVCNADLPYAYDALIPAEARGTIASWRLPRLNFGSSAYLMYLGVDRCYPQLNHHDVFLAGDVAANFDAIFRRAEVPADPSFYLCTATRTDPALAPPGHDALYVLVPVPSLSGSVDWASERESLRDRMIERLERAGLCDLSRHIVYQRTYTPEDFVADYHVKRGSAFGISHALSQVGYLRPSNKAARLTNLYFVGAGTVPGGGMPMVVIGSRLTAERVREDWGRG